MTVRAFESLNEISTGRVPYADTPVERSSSDISSVGRDGYSRNAVLDAELHDLLTSLDIPQSHRLVTTARSNMATILRKVERIDVLLVSSKRVPDRLGCNVPDLGKLADRFECDCESLP